VRSDRHVNCASGRGQLNISEGVTAWTALASAGAHRDDGKRFVVRAGWKVDCVYRTAISDSRRQVVELTCL